MRTCLRLLYESLRFDGCKKSKGGIRVSTTIEGSLQYPSALSTSKVWSGPARCSFCEKKGHSLDRGWDKLPSPKPKQFPDGAMIPNNLFLWVGLKWRPVQANKIRRVYFHEAVVPVVNDSSTNDSRIKAPFLSCSLSLELSPSWRQIFCHSSISKLRYNKKFSDRIGEKWPMTVERHR